MKWVEAFPSERVREVHALYQGEWWSRERTLEETRAVIQGSTLCCGLVDGADHICAFCRVLSDGVFKALIFDVITAPGQRGQGWGTRLLKEVLAHPQLARVRHIELYCLPERASFYEAIGFSKNVDGVCLMRRNSPRP